MSRSRAQTVAPEGRTTHSEVDGSLLPYVSSLHAAWLEDEGSAAWREIPGTLVFADVSGFTPLTERLARRGKVGAEELTDTLNTVFRELLDVAGQLGGDCLKFGGDALLLLFTGPSHERRGAAAARSMLSALQTLRRQGRGAGLSKLGMSLGVHSGVINAFLAGTSHRELLLSGPAVSETLSLESAAEAGQILVSGSTADALDPDDLGSRVEHGRLLLRSPSVDVPRDRPARTSRADARLGISDQLRDHLDGSHKDGEHRLAAIGFLKFGTTDQLLAREGPAVLSAVLHDLISQTQSACAEHAVTFLGTDVDADGGKVLLAAGAPSASPDDEDRLLLALRSVIDDVRSLPVRAGVNRGRIFAVDLGSPARRTYTVMGDAVNLAARVMGHGGWGELVATQDVVDHRHTDFALVPLEPFTVKGKAAPINAQLVGAARGRRVEADDVAMPLIGRDADIATMRTALAAAHQGAGQIMEVVGEPGIGKSKLVAAAVALDHGLLRINIEAGRYSLATPYFALRRGLREAMGLTVDAPADEVEGVLRSIVDGFAPDLEPWIPLIALPLGLELADSPDIALLDRAMRKSTMHNAVAHLLAQLLSEPTLIHIEDSHWLDAASCELLDAVLAGVGERPWAVIITRRDVAGGLDLADHPNVTTLRLTPLSAAAATSFASATVQGEALPPGVIDELVARSGGNPLFLQELLNAARRGDLDELPDTIEAVVATSIDTLPGADRSLLRHAAVLGGHVQIDVLAAMVEQPPAQVADNVRRLGHFLIPETSGILRFRHILLRDVAYEGLAFRARRALHHRAGTILEQSSDDADALAELLSIHFHRAGRYRESWHYSSVAGDRAQRNGAPIEAAAFYTSALDAARRLDDLEVDSRADVAERLGDCLELGGRYERARAVYGQARRLSAADSSRRARLCRKVGWVRDHEGRYGEAQRWFQRGLRELEGIADSSEISGLRAELRTAAVSSRLRQGRHARSVSMMELAVREAEQSGDRAALAHACFVLDQVLSDLGQLDEPTNSRRAAEIYEELGDERGKAAAYNEMGIAAYWHGRWEEAVSLWELAREADRRAGVLVNNAIYLNNIGEIRSDQGRLTEAESLLDEARLLWAGAGWQIGAGWAMSNLGRVASRDGRFDEAAERLASAGDLLRSIGAEAMLLETDAREVERLVLAGEHATALAQTTELQRLAAKLGLAHVLILLDRLEGCARAQSGDLDGAWSAWDRSLAASRERGADYETALTLDLMAKTALDLGRDEGEAMAAEARAIFDRLGVDASSVRQPT
ncbi:MAG TPA: adenylate/guanylate cyclase domain-containing protein [Acidimicrobiales bacterium]|nr:adenylate/guanylate cyclase domain-containing protein [Acidimicrobiales bacterium]